MAPAAEEERQASSRCLTNLRAGADHYPGDLNEVLAHVDVARVLAYVGVVRVLAYVDVARNVSAVGYANC